MGPIRFLLKNAPDRPAFGNPEAVSLLVRPEDVQVARDSYAAANEWPGLVSSVLFEGEGYSCVVDLEGMSVRVRATRVIRPRQGEKVYVRIPPECCVPIFDGR